MTTKPTATLTNASKAAHWCKIRIAQGNASYARSLAIIAVREARSAK